MPFYECNFDTQQPVFPPLIFFIGLQGSNTRLFTFYFVSKTYIEVFKV